MRRLCIIGILLAVGLGAQAVSTRLTLGQVRLEFDSQHFSIITDPVTGLTRISFVGSVRSLSTSFSKVNCEASVCTLPTTDTMELVDADVYLNGLLQLPGADYTRNVSVVTFVNPLRASDVVTARLFFRT
jgi:hypothetical protein